MEFYKQFIHCVAFMNKTILVIISILLVAILIGIIYYLRIERGNGGETIEQTMECLARSGVVIYGTLTCPACNKLVESFGGYEIIDPIYVKCDENWERCENEMQTEYVPEIQIKGVLYNGERSVEALAKKVGCI